LKNLKRIGWTGILAVILSASAQAGTSTGTFQGFSEISIQQVVDGQPVGGATYSPNVPTTLSFSLMTDNGYFFPQLTVSNSLYLFMVFPGLISQNQISVIDGIPGQSADIVTIGMDINLYRAYNLNGEF
jgi:hypothetical protein